MGHTRVFKSGNSQAVRIPAERACADLGVDPRITRTADISTIFPAPGSLKDDIATLRAMAKPPDVEAREPIDPADRE